MDNILDLLIENIELNEEFAINENEIFPKINQRLENLYFINNISNMIIK